MERGPSVFAPDTLSKDWREMAVEQQKTAAEVPPLTEQLDKLPKTAHIPLPKRALLFLRRGTKGR